MLDDDKVSSGVGIWFLATFIALVIFVPLCMFLVIAIYPDLGVDGSIAYFQVGLWQWLYSIPLIIRMRRKEHFESAKGVTIAACIMLGINALCSGLLLWS